MNGVNMKKIATFSALLLMSILLMQFVWHVSEADKKDEDFSAEKINLALRRTADALLREEGDSTSRIPPVEQIGDRVWLLRLERSFQYDRLPELLQSSLQVHGITRNYDVAVLRCVDGTLQLGYNFADIIGNKDAPCQGRELPPDCYNLQVTFAPASLPFNGMPLAGWFFSAVLAIILYRVGRKTAPSNLVQETPPGDPNWLQFGNSRLDVSNQLLQSGNSQHTLTYRETKLLNLFVQRPNQVLERSFILDNVWADEGILVGRSVDMFVSRLRKVLREDPSIQLVAVHGVGYRMEVA